MTYVTFPFLFPDDSYSVLQQSYSREKYNSYAIYWTKLVNNRLLESKNNESCDSKSSAQVFNYITEVFAFLDRECATNKEEIDVLVTGSLHLVGATLSAMGE